MEGSPGLNRQGMVLLDGQDLAGVVACSWAKKDLYPKPLRAVNRYPASEGVLRLDVIYSLFCVQMPQRKEQHTER